MTWYPHHRTFYVYLLLDQDNRARYVGLTTKPHRRLYIHWVCSRQAYRGDTPLRRWLLGMKAFGWSRCIHMLLLEKHVGNPLTARQREVHYIDVYRRLGCSLLNLASMPRQDTLL
jgi:hypothetical protein